MFKPIETGGTCAAFLLRSLAGAQDDALASPKPAILVLAGVKACFLGAGGLATMAAYRIAKKNLFALFSC